MNQLIRTVASFCVLAFLVAGCKEEDHRVSSTDAGILNKAHVEAVFNNVFYNASGSPEQAAAWLTEYENLNEAEVNYLVELRVEKEKEYLLGKGFGAADIKSHLQNYREFQKRLNAESQKAYGVTSNKLNPQQSNQLVNKTLKGTNFLQTASAFTIPSTNQLIVQTEAGARVEATCSVVFYGGWLNKSDTGDGYYFAWNKRYDNDANQTDCDYEFQYRGIYRTIRGTTPWATLMVGSGKQSRRVGSDATYLYTHVQIGSGTLWAYYGTNVDFCGQSMRLGN
ncbi:MAG: hypothetical protein ICV83_12360 [Cytophagales bacterium]|nr:hypothetical protein [Cytophagales bacterium]